MAGSTTKKAVIRRYREGTRSPGYVNPVSYLQPTGVELLSAQGNVDACSLPRDQDHRVRPEFRRTGRGRRAGSSTPAPRWKDFGSASEFRDGEVMEGIMPNNLLQVEHYGFTVIPPDPSSNHQRIFVPRRRCDRWKCWGWSEARLRKRKAKPRRKSRSACSKSNEPVGERRLLCEKTSTLYWNLIHTSL